MALQLDSLKEPRGIIRIIQFIFSIVAFATTSGFSVSLTEKCQGKETQHNLYYPFIINEKVCSEYNLALNVSSDCQFFVATGVLSFLYCILIIALYLLKDDLYQSRKELPIADFIITVILAVFWLSGSAAWANGTSQLKNVTDVDLIQKKCVSASCSYALSSFGKLNSSLIVGFLNFFLWASNLWFIYKETTWFSNPPSPSSA